MHQASERTLGQSPPHGGTALERRDPIASGRSRVIARLFAPCYDALSPNPKVCRSSGLSNSALVFPRCEHFGDDARRTKPSVRAQDPGVLRTPQGLRPFTTRDLSLVGFTVVEKLLRLR